MAVAHVTSSQSHASAAFSVSQASFSWTHTTSTDPQGVLILVFQGVSGSDSSTSVTYDGVTVPAVSGGYAADTATEPGAVKAYFLGSGVPTTNNPLVQVNRLNSTTTMWAVCATVTAATDTEAVGVVLLSQDGAVAQQSVDDGSTGVDSVRYAGVYYGGASPAPAGANSTLLGTTNDAGAYGWTAVRETTAGQGSRLVGCTQATSDDRAAVHLAIREVYVPPGPQVVVTEGAWADSSSPHDIVVTGCLTGDWLVRVSGGDGGLSGGGNSVTASAFSTTAGSTSAWNDVEKRLPSNGGTGWIHIAAAQVTADADVTVRATRTQTGTARAWGGAILQCRDASGIGIHGFVNTSATEVVNLAGVSQDSVIGFISVDWDAGTPATGYTPSGALDIERATEGGNYTVHCAYWTSQASGTRDYGTNGTTSATNLVSAAVEVLAAGGGTSIDADAALTATATHTATAVRAANASASLTGVAAITADAALAGLNATAALTAAANITATATVTRSAASSLTATATHTATAAIARPATAALTATAGITASATVVKSVSATLTATATHTATATTVRVATATLTATATITADGAVGVVALLTATATITATAVRVAAASAALTATATRTAAATVTRATSASITATAAITATATVTRAGAATLTATAGITATATVTGPVAALVPRPDGGTTTRPATGTVNRPAGGTITRTASTFVARPFAGTTPRP